jgi:hypothetical protein
MNTLVNNDAAIVSKPPAAEIRVTVAGTDLEFRTVHVESAEPSGSDLLRAGGFSPADQFIVLHWLATGELNDLDPESHVHLSADTVERFIIAKSDREYLFDLEERRERWPATLITPATLKRLGGKLNDEVVVVVEREGEPDEEIDDETIIDLAKPGIERFKLRVIEKDLEISVNTKAVRISRGYHTGLQIKQTAIAQGVNIKIDFLLYLLKPNGETDRIDDHQPVKVKRGQDYDAIADDDNS